MLLTLWVGGGTCPGTTPWLAELVSGHAPTPTHSQQHDPSPHNARQSIQTQHATVSHNESSACKQVPPGQNFSRQKNNKTKITNSPHLSLLQVWPLDIHAPRQHATQQWCSSVCCDAVADVWQHQDQGVLLAGVAKHIHTRIFELDTQVLCVCGVMGWC